MQSKTIKVQLNQIVDADPTHVSLVTAPANRTPYKIVKNETEDQTMINLSDRISQIFSKSAKPVGAGNVLAIITKSDFSDEQNQALTDCGLLLSDVEVNDNHTLYKQDDYNAVMDADIVQINETISVVIAKGVITYPESMSFLENLQAQSLMPSVRMASEALIETIWNIKWDLADKAEMVSMVDTAVTDFKTYIVSVFSAIPETLIKMDVVGVTEVEVDTTISAITETVETIKAEVATGELETETVITEKAEDQGSAVAGDLETETVTTEKAEAPIDANLAVLTKMDEMTTLVTNKLTLVSDQLSKQEELNSTLQEQITSVTALAKATKEEADNTIVADDLAVTEESTSKAKIAKADSSCPAIDSIIADTANRVGININI